MIKLESLLFENYNSIETEFKLKYSLDKFELSDVKGMIRLDMIVVPKNSRNANIGTTVMTELCAIADKLNKIIILTPNEQDRMFGTTSRLRLVEFYKRFGFLLNKGKNRNFELTDLMYRLPRS